MALIAQFWQRLPFVGRLLLTATTALLVAGGLMVFSAVDRETREIQEDLRQELLQELEILPGALAETVAVGDFSTLQQMLDRYVLRPQVAAVHFYDTSGTDLNSIKPMRVPDAPAWFVRTYGFSDLVGETQVVIGGRAYGRLQITLTATAWVTRAWVGLKNHLSILLLAILIDFLGIWLVLRSGLAPLSLLQEGSRRMAKGELDVQLKSQGSPELREVIAAFNQMAESISEAQRERLRRHEALELLVKHRTADLEVAKDAAEAASRAKTAFLSISSHELRTPLNGIMGTITLAMRKTQDVDLLGYLHKADRASRHLLAIINDVLDISRIESNRLVLASMPFDLDEIRLQVMDAMESIADSRHLTLNYTTERSARQRYVGDATRLAQILINLVGNALKFTEHGGVDVRVSRVNEAHHALEGGAQRLHFVVRDTGVGIRDEDLVRIFEPFEQGDVSVSRKYGGTGLGLALCRKLVAAMGGEVGVDSTPGEGSTFWFEIELLRASDTGTAVTMNENDPEARMMAYRGASVLLVEDEPINQEIIQIMLEDVGLKVFTAGDGVKAIECAQAGHFDLILMDVNMPNLSGMEATRRIRTLPQHQQTPIIALTANAFVEDRAACLEAGMNDHVGKPVRPEILFRTMADWLDRRAA